MSGVSGRKLAIDIGERDVKLLQLKGAGRHLQLTACALLKSDKASMERNIWRRQLFEEIQLAFQRNGIRGGKAFVALPDSMVNLYYRKFPAMPDGELKNAIIWEQKKDLNLPVKDIVVDYISLGEAFDGNTRMEAYLIVTVLKKPIEELCAGLSGLGVKVRSVEYSTLAQVSYLRAFTDVSGIAALVDLGASQTNIVILKDGDARFGRVIQNGGDSITNAISDASGLSWWEADKVKTNISVLHRSGGDEQIDRAVRGAVEMIVDEVNQTLHFYGAERREGAVERLVLSGGGALMPGIDDFFREILGLEVETADPLADVTVSGKVKERDQVLNWRSRMTTPVGLALGE